MFSLDVRCQFWLTKYKIITLKAIAQFVCAHPHCTAWAYGRGQGRPLTLGPMGRQGEGLCFKDYISFNIQVMTIK